MKTPHIQRGVVAVEAALMIAATFVVLPILLYLSQIIYHALVLDKAAYSAARLMAALPDASYAYGVGAGTLPGLGKGYINDAVIEAGLQATPQNDSTLIGCDGRSCEHGIPTLLSLSTSVHLRNAVFAETKIPDIDTITEIAPGYVVTYAP